MLSIILHDLHTLSLLILIATLTSAHIIILILHAGQLKLREINLLKITKLGINQGSNPYY